MADSGTNPVRPNTFELEADVNVEFNEAASRQQINSGESVKTLFGKIRKFLTDLKAVAFSGAYSDLSGAPDLSVYALKSKYGDTTINVGRKAGTDVGINSTAEGQNTTASMFCSHAEGNETTASGSCSHAEGFYAIARGVVSHAEGEHTVANGDFSHTRGFHTIANNDYETASGIYNISNSDTLFSVGDGTSDSARHNAFEITTTGGKLHDKDIAVIDDIPSELPANGGNADYAANAGNAEKLGGKDASAYSTSIIKSVTFSAATTNGYIWTGIAFPKYIVGIDLEYFDVIVQFYKGNHADAARAEWTMMFFSKDDVTTPLNGSFNGRIYYID